MAKRRLHKTIYYFLGVTLCILLPRPILEYFGVWLLGALIYLVTYQLLPSSVWPRRLILSGSVCFMIAMIVMQPLLVHGASFNLTSDYLVGLSAAILVYILITVFQNSVPFRDTYIFRTMASSSYTLYLAHFRWSSHNWYVGRKFPADTVRGSVITGEVEWPYRSPISSSPRSGVQVPIIWASQFDDLVCSSGDETSLPICD